MAPDYVDEFIQATKQGKILSKGLPSSIKDNTQFDKWRKISVDLLDVELQNLRIKNSLKLINIPSGLVFNDGEWLDYHFSYWAVLLQGLFSKYEKLYKCVERKLLKPSLKTEMKSLYSKIDDYHNRLKTLRDPVAHPGGFVEVIGQDEHIGTYIILGAKIDVGDMLNQFAVFQMRWYNFALKFTNVVSSELEQNNEILLNYLADSKNIR